MTSDAPARVEIVVYDKAWPAQFAAEQQRLARALAPWLAGEIEHIGSTAVPLMPAKPVIDIMAPVASLRASQAAIAAASEVGHLYYPYRADVMHWFCKPSPSVRTHHLHLVPHGSPLWFERLTFRDMLRAHPDLAAEYATLKMKLAAQFAHDREAYTDAELPFIRKVLELAAAR